jgi:hypothetical protein
VLITADALRPARKATLIPKVRLLLNPPDASFVGLHVRVNRDQVYSSQFFSRRLQLGVCREDLVCKTLKLCQFLIMIAATAILRAAA